MPETSPFDVIEQSIIHDINVASLKMMAVLDRGLKESGAPVTGNEWLLLLHVLQGEGESQKWYGNNIFKDKTSTMRIIDSLEKKKLVRRVPDREDRRRNLLYMTKKGAELMNGLMPRVLSEIERIRRGIADEELKTARRVLRKILANIDTL
jgi:DNA-binding MarR family transcriptional regulator